MKSKYLGSAGIEPVMIRTTEMTKEEEEDILNTIPGNITTNELQLEADRSSIMILKRALGTKL